MTAEGGPSCGGEPLTVAFYDAGQALAALVTLPDGRRILVDAGESPSRPGCGAPCREWNQRVVEGVTADLGGEEVDLIWITHQHSDHHGGLPVLAAREGFVARHYVDNGTRVDRRGVERAREAAEAVGATLHVVDPEHRQLSIADSEEVDLEAVVPNAWPVTNCDREPNACSIGLSITYCDSSVLFTGDAEEETESAWAVGDVDLLQVGHHGSNTSTSQDFLDRVRPDYAVISSGKPGEGTNRTYCHPIMSTVDRLTAAMGGAGSRRAKVFDDAERNCRKGTEDDWKEVPISDRLWLTATHGTVRLRTTGDGAWRPASSP
jgi:competence protein ComEC